MQFNETEIPAIYLVIVIGVLLLLGAVVYFLIIKSRSKNHNSSLSNVLASEQNKSNILFNAIEDGVAVIDSNRVIRLFNPAASKITGWKIEDAVGIDQALVFKLVNARNDAIPPQNNPIFTVFDQRTTMRSNDLFLQTQSNKTFSMGMSISPLLDSSQTVSGAIIIFRDISNELKQQQQRAEFISTASHEMRTPVAAIEGYLSLAMNENVSKIDTKAREYLEKAHSSTQHLGKLFQDLLTSAKAEDGRLSNHPQVIELGAFLEQLVDGLRFSAEKKGLGMEFITGTESNIIDASNPNAKVIRPLYYVNVDPDRIREVITNLFDNAVKYTENGKVSLGITGDNNVVQVRMSDTGSGIAPDDLPHLFEKFYRVDSSATRTVGGTGLGLFICRKILELYNGRIWVDSTVGRGSTFYINLPRVPSDKARQLQTAGGVASVGV